MKSTISTILGTAAIGLIKSKMGSGLRLKTKCYTYLEETYDDKREDVANVIRLINSLVPLIHENGFLLQGIKIYNNPDHYQNQNIHIRVNIRKLLTSNPDIRVCNEWLNLEQSDFEDWESGIASSQLFRFVGREITDKIEEDFQLYDIGDDFDYGYEKVIINADTGEEYTPITKKESSLRKR